MSPSLRERMQRLLPKREPRSEPPREASSAEFGVVRREGRARSAWRSFRRGTDRYRLLTDVLGAILIVALIVGGLAAATGGTWPPIIVVESGSMMHALQETPYGRIGTIDVGDMVFLKAVNGREDVTTWADGGELHYGRPGDVIAYYPDGDRNATPIIHRAIAYVEVVTNPNDINDVRYRLHWIDGIVREWGRNGIYFPPLGFDESSPYIFTPTQGYTPPYSGFITKGDNAFSNPKSDQSMRISLLVDESWIEAKVYGEVPWLGLGKLALQSGQTNPHTDGDGWERVGNAFAPLELWTMFFLTIALVILVPLTFDTIRAWRRLRREQEHTRQLEEENRRKLEARRAARKEEQRRRVVSFAEVVSARSRGQGADGGAHPSSARPQRPGGGPPGR